MAKHTPGPWTARKDNGSQTVAYEVLAGPDGRRVAIGPRWLKEHQAECEANAALIAAAPDMAEALRGLLAAYDEERGAIDVSPDAHCPECTHDTTPDSFGRKTCALHLARAALSKATPA